MKISVLQKTPKASTSLKLLWEKKIFTALIFLLATLFSQAQNITVRGRVTNESGQGVPGASVTVKGTATGVSTNDAGNFEIMAPSNGTLVISSVGFSTIEVDVKGQSTVDAVLRTSGTTMEQVVVVGYGTQKREAVTGSVASINGDVMREVPAPNISQALQGRIAGVEMTQTSTRPGANMQIRVRGTRSLTGNNDPLVVLDGIPFAGNIGDINPNDIKSVDILKDASATAIYGSRGANGVILITTNKGQRGRKAKISYNAYYGVQKLFAKYPMMNGPELVALRKASGRYSNGKDENDSANIDWQDMFYRTGFVNSHDVNLSGGTETGGYTFGLGYYQNQGVIPTQQYKRYSMRAAIDQQVGKFFNLGFTSYNNYNIGTGNQVGLYGILSMTPIANPYNPDGTLKRYVSMSVDDQYVWTRDIIEASKDQYLNETRQYATNNAIYGEVKIPGVQGLKYRVNLGLDFIQYNNGSFTGQGVGDKNPLTVSTASVDNRQTYHWTIENLLTYDRTFAQKHRINAVALYSSEQSKYNRSSMSAKDIPSEAFQFYQLGQAAGEKNIDPNGQDYQKWGLLSYMGRIIYTYDSRYTINAAVRSEGSSRLAPGHQWHTYPAASVGWNISNESFMKGISLVNMLKLRAGYGETSNQAVSPYQTLGRLSTRPYNFGDTYSTGYYVSQAPNPELGWEYSSTWNYGLDFALLKNRLSGSLEYYITDTKGILQNVSLPPTSGVSYYTGNVGKVQNKGFEVSLNGTILNNKNGWTWDVGFNLYTNNNKLVALASGKTRDEGNGWFVGHNINSIFDYQKVGLWSSAKDTGANYLSILEPGGSIGMIRVLYTGGYDPVTGKPLRAIGPDDRQIMDIDPNFQGGFNTHVGYKGFDLTAVAAFKSGGLLISNLHGPNGYLNMLTGRRGNIKVDYWTPDNPDAKYPNPAGPISGDNPKYASTLAYFDASYLKIRTITLGYDFTRSLIKTSDFKLRMYVTAQNPFVMFSPFHKESGLDPETNSYGNENVATGGYQSRILTVGFNTPSTRNYIVGLNMTF